MAVWIWVWMDSGMDAFGYRLRMNVGVDSWVPKSCWVACWDNCNSCLKAHRASWFGKTCNGANSANPKFGLVEDPRTDIPIRQLALIVGSGGGGGDAT